VADCDNAREIKGMIPGQAAKDIGGGGNILKSSGPAAAFVTEPSVFNIPSGNACLGQSSGKWADVVQSDRPFVHRSQLA
jgi:hypothetical protein